MYIGSTIKTLEKRLNKHKSDYNCDRPNKTSSCIILERKEYSIQLIETKLCETKLDRRAIERYHILNTPNCINKNIPGRTVEQFRNEHKIEMKAYLDIYNTVNRQYINNRQTEYYNTNKEIIRQKASEKHDCVCGGKYTIHHKARHEQTTKHQNYINQIQ